MNAVSMTPSVRRLRRNLRIFSESLSQSEVMLLPKTLPLRQVKMLNRDWRMWGRDGKQLPPDEAFWRSWLILGGRGAGKTRAGAEWVKAQALGDWRADGAHAERIAIIGPTLDQARAVMIEGKSGLLAIHMEQERPVYEPSKRLITWSNGAIAQLFSADDPESLRGPQFDAAWCDELAKWRLAEAAWDMLAFALRLGDEPRVVITTTPRTVPLLKRLIHDQATAVSHTATFDNETNLAKSFIADVTERYGGTRLGRQELQGELIEDDPDALFRRGQIEALRVRSVPEMTRIVIAVDPPASHGKKANACGIVCAGLGIDGLAYVLDDHSLERAKPMQWAERVVALYHARGASRVVAEVNQGGAMVEQILREVDAALSFRAVHATKAKRARAEPVAALYEQGRVRHAGAFPELEDEMCSAIGEGAKSPDRLDALVWAVGDLLLRRRTEPRVSLV
jgi:phage terminase large subunit-like protein